MTSTNRPLVVVSSRYRCRVHIEVPVTWKGTGCADCESTPRKPRRRVVDASKHDASLPTWTADPNRTGQ